MALAGNNEVGLNGDEVNLEEKVSTRNFNLRVAAIAGSGGGSGPLFVCSKFAFLLPLPTLQVENLNGPEGSLLQITPSSFPFLLRLAAGKH